MRSAPRVARRESGAEIRAVSLLIELVVGSDASVENHQRCCLARNGMISEEAPDKVMRVTDAGWHHVIRCKEQTRRFDAAGRDDRCLRLDSETVPPKRCYVQTRETLRL